MSTMSRRGFIGACALAAVALPALPAAAQGLTRTLPDGRIAIRVSSIPELGKVGGAVRVGTIDGTPVGVARTGARTYRAFSLSCPHQGVTVGRSATGWTCSAHGSKFEADGDLVLGPATTGLEAIPSRLRGGTLTIG